MFEVGVARAFEALHQLAADERDDEHEHEHDYRVSAVVRGEHLAESGMLLDIDVLTAALAACLDELDASDLDSLPAFAGRTTTVEVVAEHIWHHLGALLQPCPTLESLRITVNESEFAWASVDRPFTAEGS